MISRWPDPDRMRIGSYVASLDLRNLKSRTCYLQVLHSCWFPCGTEPVRLSAVGLGM